MIAVIKIRISKHMCNLTFLSSITDN